MRDSTVHIVRQVNLYLPLEPCLQGHQKQTETLIVSEGFSKRLKCGPSCYHFVNANKTLSKEISLMKNVLSK